MDDEGLEMEWVRHSPAAAILYALVGLLTIAYYAASFLFQYGNYAPRVKDSVFGQFSIFAT